MKSIEEKELKPLICPVCGNLELHYVTEYHKCIIGRIILIFLNMLLITCVSLLFINKFFPSKGLNMNFNLILIGFGYSFIFFVIVKSYILIIESKTHIRAICPKCGRFWNVD